MTFTGKVTEINAALGRVTYRGNPTFNGLDKVTITVEDQGSAGSGEAKTDSNTIDITVRAVSPPG